MPPVAVVRGWPDVCAVLRPGRPVTLLSAPGAAVFAGVAWWRALVARAVGEARAAVADVLDCAESPGDAVQALRGGCQVLVLSPALPAWPEVRDRAASVGATLLAARPPALDLSDPDGLRRIEAWLDDSGTIIR